jgi:Kef-type K+ transport system membrane component KefB
MALWPWLPLPAMPSTAMQAAVAVVVALLAASFSPTVTIAVVAESRARGPLTRLVMALVVVADLALIVAFALALQAVRWASGGTLEEDVGLLAVLAWELLGSVAFGGIVGAAFALYLRFVGREVTIVLIGICILLAGVGRMLHFEIVLASLTAGLVVENIAPPRGDALKLAVERGALPVLVVFFAAAGASLQLDALAAVGGVTLAIAAVRAGVLYLSSRVGTWWAKLPEPASFAWMGLVSQGGVTLGLASIVSSEFPEWGGAVYTLIIALTAVHVLVGPVLFRGALSRVGEIGKLDES